MFPSSHYEEEVEDEETYSSREESNVEEREAEGPADEPTPNNDNRNNLTTLHPETHQQKLGRLALVVTAISYSDLPEATLENESETIVLERHPYESKRPLERVSLNLLTSCHRIFH